MSSLKHVEIDYTNWQGKRSVRVIYPLGISYGHNEWHPKPQWLLLATDLAKGEERTFAMSNIHSWTPK